MNRHDGQPTVASAQPPAIADHELFHPIAAGSYGEVWLARNAVGTPRAVKIVRRDRHASAESFDREFKGLQKFEPVSRAHEGLVDILTLGRLPDSAGFYYVMELADDACGEKGKWGKGEGESRTPEPGDGRNAVVSSAPSPPFSSAKYTARTLRHDLKQHGHLPVADCIQLGLKLTAALAHLHAQGLVHRDVKPSNILFIGGEPKLADAGLVAAVDDARSLVGTAGYIAPEGPGTPQADLYALGKVLYEVSIGKDRQDFPQLLPDLRSRPDHAALLEFNSILLKACATDPRERYQSAEEMRGDLEVLRAGRSVKRRHTRRRAVTLGTKLLLAVATLGLLTTLVDLLPPRSPQPSAVRKSRIVEANDEYKKGINELHLNLNAEEAIKHFKRAVELDPRFTDAYAQLADAWYSIPGETNKNNGRVAAEKAVELDPQSGLARVFFAAAKNFALDFSAAEREAKEAVKLSPDSEEVLLASALIFSTIGLTNDALANLKKANDVGQDTPSKLRVIYSGFVYRWCRDYQSAITLYNETPWLKDGVDGPHGEQSLAYLGKGDYVSSMRLARQSALERGGDTNGVKTEFDSLEEAYKRGGQELYWQQKLKIETRRRSETHCMTMAAIHARLGHRTAAFAFLRQAKTEHPVYFGAAFYTDPSFDSLRGDPEFKDLEKQLWKK